MNCEEVQSELSTYFDQPADSRTLDMIEQHLAACSVCRNESEELAECTRLIAGLPLVDEPIAFAQRVMARAREIDAQPRLWERFFRWRMSIPLQAAAALVIGVFAVYLIQKEPADVPTPAIVNPATPIPDAPQNLKVPAEPKQTTVASAPETKQQVARHSPGDKGTRSRVPAVLARGEVPTKPAPQDARAPINNGNRELRIGPIPNVREISVIGNPSSAPAMTTTPVSVTPRGPARVWHFTEPESGVIEPFANYELIFRPRPNAREFGSNAGDASSSQVAGFSNLDELLQSAVDKSGSALWLTVPKSEYEQFKQELRARGAIEQEMEFPLFRGDGSSDDNGRYQVKVTVVAPAGNRP